MPTLLHTLANSVMKHILRSPLYYERYNNTCDFATNRNYTRYAHECRAAYETKHGAIDLPPSPLGENAATLIHGAFPTEKARAYSAKIGELIGRNDPSIEPSGKEGLSMYIREPLLTLGADILDVLKSPEVHRGLLAFFRSHYRIQWMTCFRSLPAQEAAGSRLWHSDSYPPHTCKMFLHLTEATAENGATEFMNRSNTMAYRRAGYFGQYLVERSGDLQEFAREHRLPYRPFHLDANPGDVTLFDMNFFHRGVPLRTGFRDVVQFFFMPGMVPWEEQLERDGGLEQLSKRPANKVPGNPRFS